MNLIYQHFIAIFFILGLTISPFTYAEEKHSNRNHANHNNKHHESKGHPNKQTHHGSSHQIEKRHVTGHHSKPHPEIINRGNVRHVEIHRSNGHHSNAHREHVVHHPKHRFYDSHHGHNHYYFRHGYRVKTLPPRHEIIIHRGIRFYFSTGVWYISNGPDFVVSAPPVGLTIRILPSGYTRVWVGSVPYYYANSVYYVHTPRGYMVTEAPQPDVISTTEPADDRNSTILAEASGEIFAYPRQGQSKKQEDRDRYECHAWGVDQADYDPSADGPSSSEKSADYKRAMSACLEGRGYTVR